MKHRYCSYAITLLAGIIGFSACEKPRKQDDSKSEYSNNASSMSYFIDKKRVSEKYFFDLYQKDSLIYQSGATDSRIAVIYYGEEFRNGVVFFKKRM